MLDDDILAGGSAPAAGGMPGEVRPGSFVGRYIVVSRQQMGGGNRVLYTAYDPETDRKVALALLGGGDDAPGQDSTVHRRLLREARAVARLHHPNVVGVHEAGSHGDAIYVAMELVDGMTLRQWLDERQRPWSEVLSVLIAAGRGLAAAHHHGLVHRDFEPDNVMLDRRGQVKVMTVGLLRAVGRGMGPQAAEEADADGDRPPPSTSTMTDTMEVPTTSNYADTLPGIQGTRQRSDAAAIVGTPATMSPEQIGKAVDARSDQLAFCVTAYEALWGQRPFDGETSAELGAAVSAGRVRPAPATPAVPGWVRAVVERGLRADPQERYPSMDALLSELGRDPDVRRRKIWMGAGTLGVLGVVAVVVGGSREDPCAEAPAAIEPAWNDSRRQGVEKAFAAMQVPYADDAVAQVEPALDVYAAQWIEMHEDACEATKVRHEQSSAMLDKRMACLDRRRAALDALVEAFETADATVAERAADAVRRLPSIDACGDLDALRAALPLPEGRNGAARVNAARQMLARAGALELAGRYDEALMLAEEAKRAADKARYRPLRAEAELVRGRIFDARDDADAAAEALEAADADARATGHDRVAAAAETRLVYVVGYGQRQHERGRWWAQRAVPAIERAGSDPRLEAQLHHHRGVVLHAMGRSDAGREELQAAVDIWTQTLGADHPDVERARLDLAAAQAGSGQLETAQSSYAQVVAWRERGLGPDHPRLAPALIGLGETMLARERLAEASAPLRRALAILDDDGATADPALRGRALFALARASWSDPSAPGQARALARRALEALDRAGPDAASDREDVAQWLDEH